MDPEPQIAVETGFEDAWPGADALATECVLNLRYLFHQFELFSQKAVRAEGLSSTAAFNVLTILEGAERPLLPSVIAERMIVTRATITGVLDTLENQGLIRRHTHTGDRRMVLTEITESGRRLAQHLMRRLHQIERDWLSVLSTEEQRALLKAVAKLQANMPRDAVVATP